MTITETKEVKHGETLVMAKYTVTVPVLTSAIYEIEAETSQEAKDKVTQQVAKETIPGDEVQLDRLWCVNNETGEITYPPGSPNARTDAEQALLTHINATIDQNNEDLTKLFNMILEGRWTRLTNMARRSLKSNAEH